MRNIRLADPLHQQAISARTASPGAMACYRALRARGTDHHAALRQLSNRLVGILHGCLQNRPSTTNTPPGLTMSRQPPEQGQELVALTAPGLVHGGAPWPAVLIVFAGLPGTGKTTLARLLSRELGAAHVRIDAIEAAMKRTGQTTESIGAAGYVVAEEIAATCLTVGTSVVVDAVCPVPEARRGWRVVADASNARVALIEVQISDQSEHQRRVEGRRSDLEGLTVPTWQQVVERNYRPWDELRDGPRLLLLNDGDPMTSITEVLAYTRSTPQPRP